MNYIVVDFETYYNSKDGYTLKKLSMTEYIRDARFKIFGMGYQLLGGKPHWVSGEHILHGIDWKNMVVVGHNIKFDGAILAWKLGIKPLAWIDTKAMSKAVLGSTIKNHSLATIAEHYGLEAKGILKTDGLAELSEADEASLAEYCKHDVELTTEIFERLAKDFPKGQYRSMDWTIRCFTEPILEINVNKALEVEREENLRRATFFIRPGWDRSSFSSNPKFAKLLEEKGYEIPLKLSPTAAKKGETKLIPALALGDAGFLDMLESQNQELRELCEARVAAKSNLLETRAGKLAKIGSTGPWPFDIGFSGADQTHRMSGGSGAGGNPQNLRPELRECVQAPKGMKMVVGDFSKIELVIQATIAQDYTLLKILRSGASPYCDFASEFFQRPITKNDETEYKLGKQAILGLGYGMGAERFIATVRKETGIKVDPKQAKDVVDFYRRRYYGIVRYWKYLNNVLGEMASGHSENVGFLENAEFVTFTSDRLILPSGLPIRYPGLARTGRDFSYKAYRSETKSIDNVKIYGGKVLENLCQGLAGEICKWAISGMEEVGLSPCGMVHDEILVVMDEADAEYAYQDMQKIMGRSPKWWPDIKLGSEVGVGQTWKQAKP